MLPLTQSSSSALESKWPSSTIQCGPLTISGEFDSGNALKAELIYPPEGLQDVSPGIICNQDYEINVWSRPDCYGTPFANGNRTWFYFSVRGGRPNGILKVNVINLNRQAKLFLQGMQPVFRVLPSEKPRWERISDRVVLNENKPQENGSCISFRVNLPHTSKSCLYIAFTFPFTYVELCDLLNKLDSDFAKLSRSGSGKLKLNRKDLWLNPAAENDIYFHRECVCYSLEKRRVELITVSSIHGISEKREDRLTNLFPIQEELRPFKFPGKKVIFLSARVHPGETPSSFVLNGFLKFILHKTDPRAVILRRLFVFKFVPFLNPDGVSKGHYRTDPRGINLNRVYLNPSPINHPSIYAARKLLIYYHCGIDAPDEAQEDEPECSSNLDIHPSSSVESCADKEDTLDKDPQLSCSAGVTGITAAACSSSSILPLFSEDACFDMISPSLDPHCDAGTNVKNKPYTFVLSDTNSLCAGCVQQIEDTVKSPVCPAVVKSSSAVDLSNINPVSHQCAFEACDEDSVFYENLKINEMKEENKSANSMDVDCDVDPQILSSASSSRTSSPRKRKRSTAKEKKRPKSAETANAKVKQGPKLPFEKTRANSLRFTRSQQKDSQYKNVNNPGTSRYYDSSSGLFLYVDMHGHTTKRGIFMYGNHFPDVQTQAECMLVPKLMAINSPHFDFCACNFTERLMCVKDKGGASREGSGRVACLKLTGLVRSYTLECNYNTGRIVNPVVARMANTGIVDNPIALFRPPDYTIELFEEVGKALAETVLDISGQNPFSRLTSTEFKTVDGVKRSLASRLRLSPEFKSSLITQESPMRTTTRGGMDGNGNPLIPIGPLPLGTKVTKKIKQKVLTVSQPGGPLAPKNRENADKSPKETDVSQLKKLPTSKEDDIEASARPTTSRTAMLPKTKLGKVMKSRNFPKVSSAKKLSKKKGKKKSEVKSTLPS